MNNNQDVFEYMRNLKIVTNKKYIIIHHSLTKDGSTNDWNAIRTYHINVNGWDDIGYNLGVEYIGSRIIYQLGRDFNLNGAHTIGRNVDSIGICVVGNWDIEEPPDNMLICTAHLCFEVMKKYNISIENIHPHWAYAEKTCPGKMFDMLKLRRYIKGEVV